MDSIYKSSKMPVQGIAQDIANAKQIVFGNLKEFYRLVRRKDITFTSGHADGDFQSDLQSVKWTQRITGWLISGKAFSVLKNSAT
jgi:HK97 family phage major capsid protein